MTLLAATRFVADLVRQGWDVRVEDGRAQIRSPDEASDPALEKERIRRLELIKRDEQLATPSVQAFIQRMERSRVHDGRSVSILDLMRDGSELAERLQGIGPDVARLGPVTLRQAIDPYIEVVTADARCPHTGLRLIDVWRYFRHTWTNHYSSTPGRNLFFLVRDRAADCHPVIGIACLASAVVQISERDEWIGWQPRTFVSSIAECPTAAVARWLLERLEASRDELYLDDLRREGLYSDRLWEDPEPESIERLRKEADSRRRAHYDTASNSGLKRAPRDDSEWGKRARSDLFRSKRCTRLASLLEARRVLAPLLSPPTKEALSAALDDPNARRVISSVMRQAKAETVGTEMADLVVCGAVAPYNELLGGKLVAMLSVSPTVLRAYRARYRSYSSHIASSMAGRPIRRPANLVFVGTTSLYAPGSSQYNRLRMEASVLGGADEDWLAFERLGLSRSFGTSHLSAGTVTALEALANEVHGNRYVNSIFGEGGNPKLRKIREGLDLLGWPSDHLLMHRRRRVLYGVALADNLRSYLLGMAERPRYRVNTRRADDVERISEWWYERWLARRIERKDVLERLIAHRICEPSALHGARVLLPRIHEDAPTAG